MAEKFPPQVFINRKEEIKLLKRFAGRAFSGQGKFIIVNGEAGSGKSELVKKCKEYAAGSGAAVYSVRFRKDEIYKPYQPFQEIIKEISSAKNDDTQKNTYTAGRTDIAEDIEQFNTQRFHSLDSEHSLIQQNIVSSLSRSASGQPLVIAMEDSHLASQTVWRFIHFLAEKTKEHSILMIASLRQDGRADSLDFEPVYSDIIQRMNRDGLIEKITLERFSETDVRQMVNQMLKKTDFSSGFIPMLTEISAGLPAQIIKYLQIMKKSGIIYKQNNIWFNEQDIDKDWIIKQGIGAPDVQTAMEKYAALPDRLREILQYASLMEPPFSYHLLASVLQVQKIELLKGLQKLEKLKYVTGLGGTNFQFKRVEVKAAISGLIPADQLTSMHLQTARAIEKSDFFDETKKVYLLAKHYSLTDNYSKAFQNLLRAGNSALNNFAFTEAKDLFRQALSLKDVISNDLSKSRLILLHIQSAWLDRILGNYDDSLKYCDDALKICEKDTHQKLMTAVLIQKSFTNFRLNKWTEAGQNLDRCLQINEDLSSFDRSMIYYGLGNIHFELSDYTQARKCYEDALQIAEESKEKSFIALILNNLGAVENVLGNPIAAIKFYRRAVPIYTELNNNSGLARLYNNMGMTFADEQNWQKANEYYGLSLGFSDIMGLTPLKSVTFLNRALSLAELNQLDEAKEYSFKALRLLKELKDELGMAEYHKIQALLYSKESSWPDAEEHFDSALSKFEHFGHRLGLAETQYERALMEFERERNDEAVKWLEKACTTFDKMGLYKKADSIRKKMNDQKTWEFKSAENQEI